MLDSKITFVIFQDFQRLYTYCVKVLDSPTFIYRVIALDSKITFIIFKDFQGLYTE